MNQQTIDKFGDFFAINSIHTYYFLLVKTLILKPEIHKHLLFCYSRELCLKLGVMTACTRTRVEWSEIKHPCSKQLISTSTCYCNRKFPGVDEPHFISGNFI